MEIEPLKHALYNINSMMNKILSLTESGQYLGYLTASGRSNFRFSIFPEYKANRKDARRPFYYEQIREFLQKKWNGVVIEGQEADDECSIQQYELNKFGFDPDVTNSVVCSFDKDFNNIPGWHYNYVNNAIYYIDEIQALRNFYLQILTGDNSDGIPRIAKGWKKKKAEQLIKEANTESEMIQIVIEEIMTVHEANEDKSKKDMTMRARLVHLRRYPNEMWEIPNVE